MNIEWEKFLTVNDSWIATHLSSHKVEFESKLTLRTYTIRFNGPNYDATQFISFVKESIKNYVLNEREISAVERNDGDPFEEALLYFGDTDPTYDGKFGELILYLLVESILKVPMLVFKIPLSSKDQVKGSDGIFIGNYNETPAILLGEAKSWGELGAALNSAFDSLHRFYDKNGDKKLRYEYLVSKKGIRVDLSREELDYLYDCFTLGSSENNKRSVVHPVLIIYNDTRTKNIKSDDPYTAENELKNLIADKLSEYFQELKSLCAKYKDVGAVYLDFFFIPMNDVDMFKRELYTAIHGAPPPAKRKRKRKNK